PVTPYEPSVAVRTMSMTARRVTSVRPAVGWVGTRAVSSWRDGRGHGPDEGVGRPCAILPLRSGLSGSATSIPTIQRTTHGPLLRDLRQGFDGLLHPPVGGDEPRSSPPPHEAQSPAPRHRGQGHPDQVARLHPLPTHASQVGQVTSDRPPRRSISKRTSSRPVAM